MWCGVRSLSRVLALDGAPALQVAWLDGHVSRFHLAWLRDHCPSRVDTATGQRIGRFSDLQVHPTLLEFAVHPPPSVEGSSQGPTLWLRWEAEQESRFPLQWLRQNCYVDFHSEEARKKRQPSRWTNPHSLPSFLYADVTQNPARLLQFMHTVADVGVCLLKDVPLVEGQVEEVARLVDQPMNTIYEHPFNVVSEENPINLAYTSQRLDLHQDLAYYESPPGMQLLHVLQFDESVHGGESTFLDGFALAEYMREVYPQSFQDLCRIPLTLHKDHMHRSNPVRMEYMRTVFEVNGDGDVIRFSWAPVFEGVLRAPERHVMAYYRARADLCQALQQCVEGMLLLHGFWLLGLGGDVSCSCR